MTNQFTTRPTITPMPSAGTDESLPLSEKILNLARREIDKNERMFGNPPEKLRVRAELHNLLWRTNPDRPVSPATMTAECFLDTAVDVFFALNGREAEVVAAQITKLATLAMSLAGTIIEPEETKPEPLKTEPLKSEPPRPAPVTPTADPAPKPPQDPKGEPAKRV